MPSVDPFKGWPDTPLKQGRILKQVTPDDANDLPIIPKALFVTVSGNLAIRAVDGNFDANGNAVGAIVFAVVAGQIFDLVQVGRVFATNTTATVLAVL